MKYFSLLCLIFIIFSCKKEEDRKLPSKSEDYIPLQVGNEWQYLKDYFSNNIYYISIRVEDEITINNRKYFKLIIDDAEVDMIPQELYLRKSDDGKYYQYKEGKEYYYRIFEDGLYPNATYEGYKIKCYTNGDTIDTEIGKFENIKVLAIGEVEVDGGYTDVYSKGFGLIERSWFGGRWVITYLKVGDLKLGQKT